MIPTVTQMNAIDRARCRPELHREIFLIFVCALPAALLFSWHASKYGGWLVDDAGISLAYAKNLATGHGLVAQAGSPPVEGISNPLWTLLLSAAYAAGLLEVPSTLKIISHVFVFLGFLAIAASMRSLIKDSNWFVVAGGALLLSSANPSFVIWSVSGLENPLMVFLGGMLLLFCANVLTRDLDAPLPLSSACGAGLTAAAMTLTRPDGLVYIPVFPFTLFIAAQTSALIRTQLRAFAVHAATLIVPLGAYLVFRLAYFGEWLPNTFYAKPGTSFEPLVDLIRMQEGGITKFRELALALAPALPISLPVIMCYGAFKLLDFRTPRQSMGPCPLILMTAFSVIGYMMLPTDWMAEFRFGTLSILFFNCLLLSCAHYLVLHLKGERLNSIILASLLVAFASHSYFDFRFRADRFSEKPTAPLQTVFRNIYPLQELATRLSLEKPSILIPDLGATLMYSKFVAIDLAGLCDHEIARMTFNKVGPAEFSEYILKVRQPHFVHIQGWWALKAGLEKNPAFIATYINLGSGNYLRRAALPEKTTDEQVARIYDQILNSPPPSWPPHAQF